ncbi:MAG: HAMP domain-containing histidine kinase [Oscillospiraceae bacterium]|nr:HAMP domain-containing histidine kinase [Oscillospiraceae bacterium]
MTAPDFSVLFDNLNQPVIAVFKGQTVYSNPAAKIQLGDIDGSILAGLGEEADSAILGANTYKVTVSHAYDHSIYYLSPKYTSDDLLYNMSVRLKEKITELKLTDSILSPIVENLGNEKLMSYAQSISKNISVLHRMAGNLGYFQSFDKASFFPVTFDLARAISDIADSVPVFVGDNCPNIVFKCGSGDMTVQADKKKIELALFQLLSNSLKYIPSDGTITITVLKTAKSFSVTVSDNGSGMSSKQLSTAWTPGNAEITPRSGIGVGLPIVQHIAALHGGHAIISSDENGTSVSLSIPAQQENADNFCTPAAYYDSGLSDLMLQLSEVIPAERFCSKFTD